jgi:hypothetical protein
LCSLAQRHETFAGKAGGAGRAAGHPWRRCKGCPAAAAAQRDMHAHIQAQPSGAVAAAGRCVIWRDVQHFRQMGPLNTAGGYRGCRYLACAAGHAMMKAPASPGSAAAVDIDAPPSGGQCACDITRLWSLICVKHTQALYCRLSTLELGLQFMVDNLTSTIQQTPWSICISRYLNRSRRQASWRTTCGAAMRCHNSDGH